MPAPPPESEPAIVSATGVMRRVAAIQARARASGSAFKRDVGDDGDDVGAGGEAGEPALDVEAADGDERDFPDPPLPLADALRAPCGPNRIAFRIVG